jgi:pimeloyl-ACP methyl ester carboxylesterase
MGSFKTCHSRNTITRYYANENRKNTKCAIIYIHDLDSPIDANKQLSQYTQVLEHITDTEIPSFEVLTFLAPDLPGHGQSNVSHFTIHKSMSVIRDLMLHRREEKFILIGVGIGADIALRLAYAHPTVIQGVFCISPVLDYVERCLWSHLDDQTKDITQQQVEKSHITPILKQASLHGVTTLIEPSYTLNVSFFEEGIKKDNQLISKDLQYIQCPVRMLHGRENKVTSWHTLKDQLGVIPDFDFRVILADEDLSRAIIPIRLVFSGLRDAIQ